MKKIFKKIQYNKGFTLIELMVSLMIFIVVVLAAVGSLYTVNNSSRKVQAMRTVLDNVTFAVESISRTVRTSNYVVCGGATSSTSDCPFSLQLPSSTLLIDNTLGTPGLIEYTLAIGSNGNGTIQKRVQDCSSVCMWLPPVSITAPEVNVQNLSFYVDGTDINDGKQSHVMLFVSGVATTSYDTTPFALQTYISQRATE